MKYLLMAMVAFVFTACGGSETTYVKEAPVPPATPTDGNTVLVQADNGSNVGLSYTQLGDGSILVQCGNYSRDCGNIDVYSAVEVNTTTADTTTTKTK